MIYILTYFPVSGGKGAPSSSPSLSHISTSPHFFSPHSFLSPSSHSSPSLPHILSSPLPHTPSLLISYIPTHLTFPLGRGRGLEEHTHCLGPFSGSLPHVEAGEAGEVEVVEVAVVRQLTSLQTPMYDKFPSPPSLYLYTHLRNSRILPLPACLSPLPLPHHTTFHAVSMPACLPAAMTSPCYAFPFFSF